MLEVQGITTGSSERPILARLSLTVNDGEFVSVIGPTGSGKTSLLRAILGLDLLQEGEIRYDGRCLARPGMNVVAPERRAFTLVFERTSLLPFLNVEGNVTIGGRDTDEEARKRLQEVSKLLLLHDLLARPAHTLSAGEQQRVALARSLFIRPRLLLLDEPFRNIDRPMRDRLIPALKVYLEQRETAAVLVTHDRDEAFSFAERIFLLRGGRVVRGDRPEQIYSRPSSRWEAEMLGDCNVLPIEVAREVLGFEATSDRTSAVVVRPEQLEVASDGPGNATLREIRFLGSHTTLAFRVLDDVPVLVSAPGMQGYVVGERYRVTLRNGRHVEELREESDVVAEGEVRDTP